MSTRFKKYLISYISLLLVILSLLVASVFNSFVAELRAELRSSNIAMLTQVQDSVERVLGDITKITVQMQSRLELKPDILKYDPFARYKGVQILGDYCLSNNLFSDIAVYFPEKMPGKLLSAKLGELSLSTYLTARPERQGVLDEADLGALLSATRVKTAYAVRQNNQLGVPTNYILTVCPIPLGTGTPYGYALFYMEEKSLTASMQSIFIMKDGMLGVYGATGDTLVRFTTLEHPPDFSPAAEALEECVPHATERRVDGVQYTMVTSQGESGSVYLLAMPTRQFFGPVYQSVVFFLAAVLLTFAVGLLLSVVFAGKNSRLISALLGLFPGSLPDGEDGDAYIAVKKRIQMLSSSHVSMLSESKTLQDIARSYFLNMLVSSYRFDTSEFRRVEQFSGIRLDRAHYRILLFHIVNYEEFAGVNGISSQDLSLYGICNILEDLLSEAGKGYAFVLSNRRNIALLFNYDTGGDDEIVCAARAAAAYALQYYGVVLTAGVGEACGSYEVVGRSFFEASKAILLHSADSTQDVRFFQQADEAEKIMNLYPKDLEGTIVQCVRAGQAEEAERAAVRFIYFIKQRTTSRDMLYDSFFTLLNSLIRELEPLYPALTQQLYSGAVELFSKAWTGEFESGFRDALRGAAAEVAAALDGRKLALTSKVTDYVQAHCYEQTLSISLIADTFGFTPSYLTRFFRTQTGYTLKDYIDKMRMERARLLLRDSSLTLREIVRSIGYVNESNFIKKFKALENITPSQYRSVTRKKE